MFPTIPPAPPAAPEPNLELLRRAGWSPSTISGPYCVAFRGPDEVVFRWDDAAWHRVVGDDTFGDG